MMKFKLSLAVCLCGGLPAAAVGLSDTWRVIEIPARHACYRTTSLPSGNSLRVHGPFNTFRQAGMWEWGHRSICRIMDQS
jgi:hypothetical protein